jgi:hypothetical protein
MTFVKPVKLIAISDFQSEVKKYFPGINWSFGQNSSTGNYIATCSHHPTEKYWEFEVCAEPKYKSDKIERWLALGGVYGAEGRTLAEMLSNLKMTLTWKPSDYKTATLNYLMTFPNFAELKADPIPQEWKPSEEDYELVRKALKKEYIWTKGYLETDKYSVVFNHDHRIQFKGLEKTQYSRPDRLDVPVASTMGQKFTLVVYTDGTPPMITGR